VTDGFWTDLKRRRVGRAAAAYVAVAFAGLEGAELILPRLGLPDRVLTVLVILTVLGFPVAIVLSWLFDVSPGGITRTASDTGAPTALEPGDARAGVRGRLARLAALGIVTVAFAWGAWMWIPRASGFGSVDVDPNLLLILPFEVRGSDEVAYLREGMVDLVSTKLDGVGELAVLDPQASLSRMRERGSPPSTPRELSRLASELGAGRALTGSVVWVEGSLQVRAIAYGPGEGDRIEASAEGSSDGLFGLVDELVARLVAGGLIDRSTQLSSLEGLTTRSNEALRLYLTGVQNFRLGRGMSEDFQLLTRAVALDSTFALASYWAGYVADYDVIEDPLPHYERAMRHGDRLGQRDRMRLTAAHAGAQGRHEDAIRYYQALVARYPDDLAGWFQLAEQVAHTGRYVGRTAAEARHMYERVIALDPAMAPAYYHLSVTAAQQGDSTALREWAAVLEEAGTDSLQIAVAQLERYLVIGDLEGAMRAFDRYLVAESDIPPATLAASLGEMMGATLEHAPRASRAMLTEFVERALTDTARTVAVRQRARVEAASGRFEEAEAALRSAQPPLPEGVLAQDLAWIALHPATDSRARKESAREALSAVRPTRGSGEAAARHYLMALLDLGLGNRDAFDAGHGGLRGLGTVDDETARFARDLLAELDAVVARSDGNPQSALGELLRASYWQRDQPWLGFPESTYLFGPLPDRLPMFLRAELLYETGQDSAAAVWYGVAAEGTWYRGPSLLRLAEISAKRGAREDAAQLLARVQRLWADGDEQVAGVLREAQATTESVRR
jgi:tetratricopeptide (TPR) repeat protein/TolB-like protein